MNKKIETPLDEYKKEYIPDIYKEYTGEELMWWILNLVRRSTHRTNKDKSLKDIKDARNYLWMLEEKVKEEEYD